MRLLLLLLLVVVVFEILLVTSQPHQQHQTHRSPRPKFSATKALGRATNLSFSPREKVIIIIIITFFSLNIYDTPNKNNLDRMQRYICKYHLIYILYHINETNMPDTYIFLIQDLTNIYLIPRPQYSQ